MGFSFSPTWPPSIDGLVVFGGIVLIGLLGGRLVHFTGFLPRISGFILRCLLAKESPGRNHLPLTNELFARKCVRNT